MGVSSMRTPSSNASSDAAMSGGAPRPVRLASDSGLYASESTPVSESNASLLHGVPVLSDACGPALLRKGAC